jgi:hypothetical protein
MERYLMVLPEVPIAESELLGKGCRSFERDMWQRNTAVFSADIPKADGPRKLRITFMLNGRPITEIKELVVRVYDALAVNGLVIDQDGMVDIEPAHVHNCTEKGSREATIVELWELPPREERCSSGQLDS